MRIQFERSNKSINKIITFLVFRIFIVQKKMMVKSREDDRGPMLRGH